MASDRTQVSESETARDKKMKKAAIVAVSLVAAAGAAVGIAVATSKPASASSAAPPVNPPNPRNQLPPPGVIETWLPVAPTPLAGAPTGMAFVLGPGTYRFSVDAGDPNLNPTSTEGAARIAFAGTLPAQLENHLVTYDFPAGTPPATPANWDAADRAKPGRIRSSFVVTAGSSATIPLAYNDQIWMLQV